MARLPPYRMKLNNPQKYDGDPNEVWIRSTYEKKFYTFCDNNVNIVSWHSEETVIPYVSPVDGKVHRYFVDAKIKVKGSDGKLNTYLIEIKPQYQIDPPKPKKRMTKQYVQEVMTYGVNQAKWKYAEEYCKDRGWKFVKLNEYNLGIAPPPKANK
jgi:hypothetical protein